MVHLNVLHCVELFRINNKRSLSILKPLFINYVKLTFDILIKRGRFYEINILHEKCTRKKNTRMVHDRLSIRRYYCIVHR